MDDQIGRHKRNVKKMIEAGAPEADIDAYLSGEGVTIEQMKAHKVTATPVAPVEPEIAAPKSSAALSGVSRGLTLGADQHVEAAMASLIPSNLMAGGADVRFGDYKGNLEKIRGRNSAIKKAAPKTFLASEIGAGIAGLGKVAKAGATATKLVHGSLTGTKKLAATTAALAADGAAIGGLSAGFDGKNTEEIKKSVKTGALAGGLGGVAVKALGRGFGAIAGRFKPSEQKAANALLKTAQASGKSPDQIKASFKSATDDGASEYMLMDALGEAGVRRANGISRSGGDGGKIIREGLDARQAGQSGRVVNILDDAFETGGKTGKQLYDDITAKLRTTDKANFSIVPDDMIQPTKALAASKVSPKNKAIQTRIERRMNNYTKMIGEGRVSTQRLIDIRRQVADDADKAFRSGNGNLGTQLKELKRSIDDDILAVSPKYREANKASSEIRGVREKIDEGVVAATRGRAGDIVDDVSVMSKDQTEAFRTGMADKLIAKTEGQAVGSNAARPLQSDRFKEISNALIPNAKKLQRQVDREGEMFANRARITGGSQTADNLADSTLNGTIPAILRGDYKSVLGTTFVEARNKLSGLDEPTRTEIARMLMSRSNDKLAVAAAKRLKEGKKLERAHVNLVYGAIITSTAN